MKVQDRSQWKGLVRLLGLSLLMAGANAPSVASATPTDKTSNWQPAIAAFNGKLYLAYTGLDGRLNVASSIDGQTFGASTIIPNNSSAVGPGLTAFNGNLYIAWAATDGRRTINIMRSADGVSWVNKQLFGSEASRGNPAIAGSSSQLLIAWNGTDNARTLNIGCIVCLNAPYGTKVTFQGATSDYGVGLAAINENFFLAYRDRYASAGIRVAGSPAYDPLTFGSVSSVGTAIRGPGITGSGGFAYVGWVGSANFLNVATFQLSGTTTTLVSQSLVGSEISDTNPALASLNGHLYYVWLGTDRRINITQLF